VHKKKLYSELLDETFHINVTTAALRTIDKMGGLDNYILYTKTEKLDSLFGMGLKERLKEVCAPTLDTLSSISDQPRSPCARVSSSRPQRAALVR
jgi:large subunit ribosomal protein L28